MNDEIRGLEEIQIIGDVFPVTRKELGLWSVDRALGNIGEFGIPLRSLTELYGPEHSGKSTFAWYICAVTSPPDSTIWIADLEGTLDKEYARRVMTNAEFRGTVRVADYTEISRGKERMRTHEEQMQDAIDALLEPEVSAGIIDSVGSFSPIIEFEKKLGERNVGQKAITIGDASRRISAWLRRVDEPKLFFYINHTHPNIGGRGFSTPGGETKRYMSNTRIWIRRIESDIPKESGNFLAEVRVQKLKFGGAHAGRRGHIFFIPNYGVSREMSAVFDCVEQGLAERGAVIRLEGESFGRIGDLIEKAQDPNERQLFEPFYAALKGLNNDIQGE